MLIRPMVENDLPTVHDIELRAYESPWTLEIMRDCIRVGYGCWILEHHKEIIGYAIMAITPEGAHVLSVSVDPKHHRHGYGRYLMQYMIALAKINNAKSMFLEVRISNVPAIKLYESLGFNRVDIRENYYPKGSGREDGFVYALEVL